ATHLLQKNLELVKTTDPEVTRRVWLNNKSHFACNLSDEVWLAKAALRTGLDLGPGVEHKIWVLVPRGRGNDPSAILSAVHTYERAGLMTVATKVSDHTNSAQEDSTGTGNSRVALKNIVIVYVLLVFTPVEHRKRGYARTMLKMLKEQLEQQTDPAVELSFLFSSVGRDFYEPAGWPAVRSRELVLNVQDHVFPELSMDTATNSWQLEDITEANLQVVMDRDIELLRAEMQDRTLKAHGNCQLAAIVPEARIFRGQLAVTHFTHQRVLNIEKPIIRTGVRLNAANGGDAFIIWAYHISYKILLVLRTRYETVGQLQCLLKEAVQEAREWGLARVAVWDLKDEDAHEAAGVSNRDRTVAWSCIGQLGRDTDTGARRGPVDLMLNEGYIWGL
ncbi:hypothetical protein BGZ54_000641, partial [Gamsiella multidivaricata]